MIYLISYDLFKKDAAKYKEIDDIFLKAKIPCIKALSTVWLIETPHSADVLYKAIGTKFTKSDKLLIAQLNNSNYQGWLDSQVVGWLKARNYTQG